jgi:phage gp46-like protein
MFCDLALTYDPESRRCDLTLGDDLDLVLDTTPVSAMLVSIGLDRRADADDPLPEGRSQFLAPASFSERRGGIGDAFDAGGNLSGSKLWLLERAKETETTRLLCEFWLEEALSWAVEVSGQPAEIEVEWIRPEVLGFRVMIEDTSVSLTKRVDA